MAISISFWMLGACVVTVVSILHPSGVSYRPQTAASRTRWKFRTDPTPSTIAPSRPSTTFHASYESSESLFPPIRSQRRISGLRKSSSNPDSVVIQTDSGDFNGKDRVESDHLLNNEIQRLNDSLFLLMNQRRPSYSPDGSIHLFPTPNFLFIPDIGPLRQLFQWGTKSVGSYAICHACRVGLGYLLLQARTNSTLEDLSSTAIFICKFFNIANEEVCTGLVRRFGSTMYFILTKRLEISSKMFCGIVLQPFGCASASYLADWTVELPKTVNWRSRKTKRASKPIIFPDLVDHVHQKYGKLLKVLHLTDIHLDPEYRAGAKTDCDTELCCREADGPGKGENVAGFYGDYRKCDLPLRSLEDALQHISKTHPDISLVYMTGDLAPHNIWNTDAKKIQETIRTASQLIRKYLPNTPVIPVLGNHDVHPTNLFSPPGIPEEFSTAYIYAVALREWGQWIPKEAYRTFLHSGFYSFPVSKNFKVIALNTNVCYTLNFWQVFEHRDPGGQLQWLVKELYEAESVGAKVHILGHIPPSLDECWSTWQKNFYKIISRFSTTVTSQFYGHTHYDEFQLYYHNEDKGRPISPLWIGASLTPWINLNPAYKIFSIDGNRGAQSSWNVIDHETWTYNLEEANSNLPLPPRWYRLYKATEAYGIPDVLPHSLNAFVHRMSSNLGVFNQYYRNYHKATEISLRENCDTSCRKRILCRIVTPHYFDQKECIKIQSEVDGVVLPRQTLPNKTMSCGFRFPEKR